MLNLEESWSRVTPTEFKALVSKAKNTFGKTKMILIEVDEDQVGYLATTFTVDSKMSKATVTQSTKEILPENLEEFVSKKKNPLYRLIEEVPDYLRIYSDDTEFLKEFQSVSKKIADLAQMTEVDSLLAELVGFYRLSERSGYGIAEMYLEDISLLADIPNAQESA